MSTLPTGTVVDERLIDLRAQLQEIETERTDDPLSAATDIAEWRDREDGRLARATAIARQIRELEENGALVADDNLAAIVASYRETADNPRGELRPLIRRRRFPSTGTSAGTAWRAALDRWWAGIARLIASLPNDDPAARRLIQTELNAWVDARNAYYEAVQTHGGQKELPHPERATGQFPGGYILGVHDAERAL